ncbi:hypothetical protein JAAARDRAFT_119601 [Jaapia argillacea MUCL 33604]|uniref:F-box domain-containing protein n=1 Tax=Jaapia argillacea MUCL 33604 TaxID=933084 RepID=A0A067QKM8_9AGAM|nr:hypothetical protein JAAARDRAFT_119601 [Jaapia argillacea MUCL 33604]
MNAFGVSLPSPADLTPQDALAFGRHLPDLDPEPEAAIDDPQVIIGFEGKGKGKELPPNLPPLSFSPGFGYSSTDWPSPVSVSTVAGPSSYGSGFASVPEPQHMPVHMSTSNYPTTPEHAATLSRVPSRRRSLSNLSIRSTRSVAARSVTKMKTKFGGAKGPSNLARKLFKKRGGEETPSSDVPSEDGRELDLDLLDAEVGCFLPWRMDGSSRAKASLCLDPAIHLDLEESFTSDPLFLYRPSVPADVRGHKPRAYSYPLSLDMIAPTTGDVFKPIPLTVRNYFDEKLPRELKLHVLKMLVSSHESEYERRIQEGRWTVLKASSSKNKWVGRHRGIRELVKLRRVCRVWQDLVFDGQLWADLGGLPLHPSVPDSLVCHLTSIAGPFIRGVDFAGHARLLPETAINVADALCIRSTLPDHPPFTQLTTINLQGCTALTTRALNHIIMRSPLLQNLNLKGLSEVTNTTCDVIGVYCPRLLSLDLSRCPGMTGEGIRLLAAAALSRGDKLQLKTLKLSGLKRITDSTMEVLGRAAPDLEVLDLSYSPDLHNSALDAFVACAEDEMLTDTVLLSARDLGRDPGDSTRYRRRVTMLRHLSLSSCTLLTDIACSNLAFAVPRLEFLELAGLSSDLKDEGLIRLLNSTPNLRRLDLEDAVEISDAVIRTITPAILEEENPEPLEPQVGQALEHLIISYAANVTNDALLSLIRNCRRLRILEADSTRISASTLKEFVKLARSRQTLNAKMVAIDCRGIGESVVSQLSESVRPRHGWRAWEARKLGYLDGRDEEGLDVGQDECDEKRVILKTFYSWQTVDAVKAARDKRRKSNTKRTANGSSASSGPEDYFSLVSPSSGRSRWWSPGGRFRSGSSSPTFLDAGHDRDGCTIM